MAERDLNSLLPGLLEEPAAAPPPPAPEGASEVTPPVAASPDYDRRIADLERQLSEQKGRAETNRDAYQQERDLRVGLTNAIEEARQRELQRQNWERSMAPVEVPDLDDVLDKPEKLRALTQAVRAIDERSRGAVGLSMNVASHLATQTQSVSRRDHEAALSTAREWAKEKGYDDFDDLLPEIQKDFAAGDRQQPGTSAQLFANPEAIKYSYLYHRDKSGKPMGGGAPAPRKEKAPASAPVTPQAAAAKSGRVPIQNPEVRKMYAEFGLDPDKGVDAERVGGIYGTPFQPGTRGQGAAR